MALPATDNFNRADNALETSSANWTKVGGQFSIQSNHIVADGTDPSYNWNADIPNDAQYAQIKLTAVGSDVVGPAVRVAAAAATYYGYKASSSDRLLVEFASGSETTIASVASGASANDVLRLEASSSTLTPKRNGSTDAGIGAQTDSTLASGRLGVCGTSNFAYDTNGDDWEGGNLGGTAYNQSVSGGVTPVGALLKQDQKILAGSIAPSGVLIALRTAYMVLTGAITPTGDLVKETQKVLIGAVTPVGALINQAQKVLSGSIEPSGTLATVKTFLISLVGSITPIGNLLNETQKTLSGSIASIGDLVKQTQKVLDGSVTPNGILTAIRTILVSLVGSIVPSGTLVIQTQKVLIGSITPSGIIIKLIGKLLDGIITPTSTLVGVIVGAGSTTQIAFKGMFKGMFRRM